MEELKSPFLGARRPRVTPIRLQSGVIGASAPLRADPGNVLARVLDIAGFAVDAVLSVDLKAFAAAGLGDDLVDTRRTIALRRLGVLRQIHRNGDVRVGKLKMYRLVLLMVG